ncbi:hypothetical protein SADUNF_Sadunf15G0061200 [Salix dunnii]|uniref:Uncharacterized protein n=1 Tax=Salix dunnii TaxID=1413687 RepID=A0A835JE87_9ROSI|nr:hypothetical protein SADUNF_Sadunf15G0061200 [Salix dunnii]
MGLAIRAGDWTFKVFTVGLGVATTYLAATFSVNVYRGLSWHNTQSVVMGRNLHPHGLSIFWYLDSFGVNRNRRK